eukprot:CAMPEP_0185571192 /NCGR_PEP_ID=MMETSP0434-20130131/3262_1 /TAXON_ID=626734 ORGANISM="Favella taraikaensis, Strain Fe Narragansett Bay" /NCGR_SAMPLE_ID=MMETSP0434 /ASSEMBLY_ACC=CAM_ASM_000379 /LENGTH=108 /DNA_ID=CAMNT_0028186511 /DNA_START=253 /DNA_END=579 /DNA_ORIENTATION=+
MEEEPEWYEMAPPEVDLDENDSEECRKMTNGLSEDAQKSFSRYHKDNDAYDSLLQGLLDLQADKGIELANNLDFARWANEDKTFDGTALDKKFVTEEMVRIFGFPEAQ